MQAQGSNKPAANRPKTRPDCPAACGGRVEPLGNDNYRCGNCKRIWMGFELLWQDFQDVPCRCCKQSFGTNDSTDRLCPDCRFRACLVVARKLNPALPPVPEQLPLGQAEALTGETWVPCEQPRHGQAMWDLWHAVEATNEKLSAGWCWSEEQQARARQTIANETARLERLPKKELRRLIAEMERETRRK